MAKKDGEDQPRSTQLDLSSDDALRRELVAHFRASREALRAEWVRQMTKKGLLAGLTEEETEVGSIAIYDIYVDCLDTGQYGKAQEYAEKMVGRGALRRVTPRQIFAGLLTLRDIFGWNLLERYGNDQTRLFAALDTYEPVANEIVTIVALAFAAEGDKVIRLQQEAIRELSTPVLKLRDRLLLLPIIGALDSQRANQLTEQLLNAIRDNRAKVVVVDITGVPAVDSKVANHLIQTVEASRLMGASVIVTGLSPQVAQALVTIGVDLSRIRTIGDMQGGIDEADRLLGYRVLTSNGMDANSREG
ncbi:MAG: STAS domain-containing protein [Actinobacteria bacterium]|nr:STAS domain-containing protein [Actinomycetota bacterium]